MSAVTEAMVAGFEQVADQIFLYGMMFLLCMFILALIIKAIKKLFRKFFK